MKGPVDFGLNGASIYKLFYVPSNLSIVAIQMG